MEKNADKKRSTFNIIFDIGVVIKGIDGLAELIAGIALLVSPGLVHKVLMGVVGEANEGHTHVHHLIAEYIGRLDGQLAASGLLFLIVFLLTHGLVKIGLVYCLLKKIVRAYPIALAILTIFLAYQIYVFVTAPTIGMAIFCILDVAIIGLVWREYRILSAEKVV